MKALTVLSVAYPFAPVAPDTAGGAEQVLLRLDRGLTEAGHESVVVACRGSRVSGELIDLPPFEGDGNPSALERGRMACRQAIERVLAGRHVDLVHMHGIDFHAYLPPPGPSALVTLHLPISWYPTQALWPSRSDTWFNCVSRVQQQAIRDHPWVLGAIENGVDLEEICPSAGPQRFVLVLGRICPEKGIHLAMDAAILAGVPLLIGGEVFPYAAHRRYFQDEVLPRLGSRCRWLGPLGPDRKKRLLAAALCLLVPSQADETSSLVAREAAAAGTPVVAFPRGALPEVVEDGRTGFLVSDVAAMAAAIPRCRDIDRHHCRRVASERFDPRRMITSYFGLYQALALGRIGALA